jgi:hypothetical protein
MLANAPAALVFEIIYVSGPVGIGPVLWQPAKRLIATQKIQLRTIFIVYLGTFKNQLEGSFDIRSWKH